jgi:hypothetical protein
MKISPATRLRAALCAVALALLAAAMRTHADQARPSQSGTAVAATANDECTASDPQPPADSHGEISLAQPKVWQSERVASLLDGLLRDVEGVSLSDLTQLSPNAQNAAAVRFVQSALEVSAQFDQAALVNNRANLQNADVRKQTEAQQVAIYRQQTDATATYAQALTDRRAQLTQELFATNAVINEIQPRQDAKATTKDEDAQLVEAQSRAKLLTLELTDVNARIPAALAAPTLTTPTVQNTTGTIPASLGTGQPFGDVLKALPDDVQKSLSSALKSPTYPATKQLDNFITLLQERMAREISVLQDDVMRDASRAAYLLQFDNGLYPSKRGDNYMARVAYELDCPECQVYSVYPSASSYNVVNYQGASRRRTLGGSLLSIVGLGISAAYRRQEDALQGNLVQSVYVSGFQSRSRFGWYFNAPPFDQYVTPGIRSTFAIVSVPRDKPCLRVKVKPAWMPRDSPDSVGAPAGAAYELAVRLPPAAERLPAAVKNEPDRLHVLKLEYNTVYHDSKDDAKAPLDDLSACPRNHCAAVRLTLDMPIDPNLVITVNGRPLSRVRDWRGRATSILPPAQSLSDGNGTGRAASRRALIEVDDLAPNSWFATTSRDILLNISRELAEEDWFPVIQIAGPGRRALLLPIDLDRGFTELVINGFHIVPRTRLQSGAYASRRFKGDQVPNPVSAAAPPLLAGPYPTSTFLPLFAHTAVSRVVSVTLGPSAQTLVIAFTPSADEKGTKYSFLTSRTQVILEDEDLDFAWSLLCRPRGDDLLCDVPVTPISETYRGFIDGCQPATDCPALRDRLRLMRNASGTVTDHPFVDSLQLWVEQYDPDGKDAFYAPHPIPLGLFPLDGDQIPSGHPFQPWTVVDRPRQQGPPVVEAGKNLEECAAFPWPASRLVATPTSGEPFNIELPDSKTGCRSVRIDAFLGQPALDWRVEPAPGQKDAANPNPFQLLFVSLSFLKPEVKKPVITPIRQQGQPFAIDRWTVRLPVTNLPAMPTVQPAARLAELGAAPVIAGDAVTLTVTRRALADWPSEVTVEAGGKKVVALPDMRALLLPTRLSMQPLGEAQFALTGARAGVIDAVAIVRAGKAITIPASAGTDVATFDLRDAPAGADKKPQVPDGTYAVLPLFKIGQQKRTGQQPTDLYSPIDALGTDEKALTLVKEKPRDPKDDDPGKSVTKITKTIERTQGRGATPKPVAGGAPTP